MTLAVAPPLVLEPWTPPPPRKVRDGHTRAIEDAWNKYAAAALAGDEACRSSSRRRRYSERVRRHRLEPGITPQAAHHLAGLDAAAEAGVSELLRRMPTRELERHAATLADTLEGRTVPGYVAAERRALEVELETARAELELRAVERRPRTAGEALIFTSRESARRCRENRASFFRCGCVGRLHYVGCERVDCVRCAPRVTKDRARRVFLKLRDALDCQRDAHGGAAVKDSRLWAVRISVFTMPPAERENWVSAAAWKGLRRRLWHLLRDEFEASWACIATHPVGDEDPRIFHPHLNVLWARKGIARGFIPPAELERLKRRWAELLGVEGVVDVWGGYVKRDEEKKLRHRARYYSRVFVGWHTWIPKAIQWYGAHVPLEKVPACVCDECGQAFVLVAQGDAAVRSYHHHLEIAGEAPAPPPRRSEGARA